MHNSLEAAPAPACAAVSNSSTEPTESTHLLNSFSLPSVGLKGTQSLAYETVTVKTSSLADDFSPPSDSDCNHSNSGINVESPDFDNNQHQIITPFFQSPNVSTTDNDSEENSMNVRRLKLGTPLSSSNINSASTVSLFEAEEDIEPVSHKKSMAGLICIAVLLVDFLAQSEMLGSFDKPWLLRFTVNTGYMIAFIPWYILSRFDVEAQLTSLTSTMSLHSDMPGYNWRLAKQLCLPAFYCNTIQILSGYLWYISLEHTQVAVNNTVFESQCVFVYVLGAIFLNAKVSFQKTTAVIISLGGVALVSFASHKSKTESGENENTIFGLSTIMASALTFGIYEVLMKYFATKHFSNRRAIQDTLLLQAIMGLVSLLTMWPIFFFFNSTGIETFEIPSVAMTKQLLLIVGLDFIFIAALLIGTTLTSPLIMAMSQLLMIPLSFVYGALFNDFKITVMASVGSVLVIVGFVLIEVPICSPLRKRLGIKHTFVATATRYVCCQRRRCSDSTYKRVNKHDCKHRI